MESIMEAIHSGTYEAAKQEMKMNEKPQEQKRTHRRKALSPMAAIQDAFEVMMEATYEDMECTPEEVANAHRRFENAINYLAARVCENQVQDLWAENQRLRERVTELELNYNQLRSVVVRLEERLNEKK